MKSQAVNMIFILVVCLNLISIQNQPIKKMWKKILIVTVELKDGAQQTHRMIESSEQ